jgi:hypothetical protein
MSLNKSCLHLTPRTGPNRQSMNLAEADLAFPVLCFTKRMEIWGASDVAALTNWSKHAFRRKSQIDMELVDIAGRRVVVRSIRKLPRHRFWPVALAQALIGQPKYRRVELGLEELPTMSLEGVKTRFIACLMDRPRLDDDYAQRSGRRLPIIGKQALLWIKAAQGIGDLSDRKWIFPLSGYLGPSYFSVSDLYGRPPLTGRLALFGDGRTAP